MVLGHAVAVGARQPGLARDRYCPVSFPTTRLEREMTDLKLGVALWSQVTDWPQVAAAARRLDGLGYDHLWTWDHIYAPTGDPYQPVFEGTTLLAALAAITEHVELGLFVGANTFRNPGLVAKAAATLDHVSGGRAIVGLGAAWFELEHEAHGIDFGASPGERIGWLDEAAGAIRSLLAGETVSSPGGAHYRFHELRHSPRPVRSRVPLMIGGAGEQRTLRVVARHADLWNLSGTPDELSHKDGVLRDHCRAVGRDEREIERTVACKMIIRDSARAARAAYRRQLLQNDAPMERLDASSAWLGTPETVAQRIEDAVGVGFATVILEMPTPYDEETFVRLVREVRPLVMASSDVSPSGGRDPGRQRDV
jgi:alkanesulfonate monooxygenase SsuD/methylene tetrahydromethanopterin reductase-like flavin-dependent oxidoreductase (luciferase family)